MNYCSNCGAPLGMGGQFCSNCGANLNTKYSSISADEETLAAKLSRQCIPACVMVKTSTGPGYGHGSGFICSGNRFVITNYHVVEGAHELSIVTAEGKEFPVLNVVSGNRIDDVAILSVDYPKDYEPRCLKISDDNSVSVGDFIMAIGSPRGEFQTVSDGIVSALRLKNNKIQMTAPISRGSSGGPVIDRHGNVIGISASGRKEEVMEDNTVNKAENLNFAIPAATIRKYLPGVELLWQKIRDLKTEKNSGITCLALSPLPEVIFAADSRKVAYKFGVETGTCLRKADRDRQVLEIFFISMQEFYTIEYSEDNNQLICQCWREEQKYKEETFGIPIEGVPTIVQWTRGMLIAVTRKKGKKGTVTIYRIDFNKKNSKPVWQYTFNELPNAVSLSYADDIHGLLLMVALPQGLLEIMRYTTKESVRRIKSPYQITTLKFKPDGMGMILGGSEGQIWEWSVFDIRREKLNMQIIGSHDSAITSFAFSHDSKTLAAGGKKGNILLWQCEKK